VRAKKNGPENKLYRVIEKASIGLFLVLALVLALVASSTSGAPVAPPPEGGGIAAHAHAMPNQGWAPLTVYYSAFGSASSAGEIIKIEWDLDANGFYDVVVPGPNGYTQYTYSKPGTYTINLRVTDSAGGTATDTVQIEVRHPNASSVDYWTIFDDSEVRRITFEITQENWDILWTDIEAKQTVPVDAVIFGERLEQVGLRMRGQFSLRESGLKKPWKIDTDYYIPGQEYKNLKQLLFINNVGDPSLVQEKLAYEMMQFAGVPASFVTYVEIWFQIQDNNSPAQFWGVYTLIERVDRKFLANRFGQDAREGNLYKASHAQRGPMDLAYYGENIADFPTQDGQVAYGKMTNEEDADYSDIIQLTRVIDGRNYATPEDFAAALEGIFNVDGFLRYMAVADATMNWDIYPYTGNNYYLFNNSATGKFEWIPWDLTWGENPQHPVFETNDPGIAGRTPLHTRVFQVPEYRLRYAAYLDLLMRHFFNPRMIGEKANTYQTLIEPHLTQGEGDKAFFGPEAQYGVAMFQGAWQAMAARTQERAVFLRQAIARYQNLPTWGSQPPRPEGIPGIEESPQDPPEGEEPPPEDPDIP
jgi:spore coat protein CotH